MIAFAVGLSWGIGIGVVLALWASHRYLRNLHERVLNLETAPVEFTYDPSPATLERIQRNVFLKIAALLEADEQAATKH